ncbi:ATP-binding protein [Burkholderia cepacia]|uniref:ATP-binding protein n=1 Tax=Burkholderia cepacia TaxID=292 RepID=UPI000757D799|nr:ATP-binding protein [Burkholderia cepacia]
MKQEKHDASENDTQWVEFTVDAALLRELGERLVGKPHVALAELVKNAYDADATRVVIRFGSDSIEVSDDGHGMTADDFRRYWMRIGTTHKQKAQFSPRLKRPVTGSKGIGRLSAQFLGTTVELWSKTAAEPTGVHATVDWAQARQSGDLIRAGAFMGAFAPESVNADVTAHGTRVRISGLHQTWSEEDLKDLARELWFLKPPLRVLKDLRKKDRFDVSVEGVGEQEKKAFAGLMNAAFTNWIAEILGELSGGREGAQASVTVRFKDRESFTQKFDIPNCELDEASFRIRIYKLSGRQPSGIGVDQAREYFNRFGGVHIYDDDFRLPFYGGGEQDWLRLEIEHSHRLMTSRLLPDNLQVNGGLQDLPTLGRVFGVVKVSTSHERAIAPEEDLDRSAYLNIQLTRDRLIANQSFENLVYMVRWAFHYYANLSYQRRQKRIQVAAPLPPVMEVFDDVKGQLQTLRESVPESAKAQVVSVLRSLSKAEDVERKREEALANEKILLGALATAGMGALALEHELGKELIALRGELTKLRSRRGKIDAEQLVPIVDSIEGWVQRASNMQSLFTPLMNKTDRETRSSMLVRKVVAQIAHNSSLLLRDVKVDFSRIDAKLRFPSATLAAWNAILQNVFVNAVNAMIDEPVRRIVCESYTEPARCRAALLISDTGAGVDLSDVDELFKPFVRRLELTPDRAQLGLGGVGLGLTIVKSVADSVGCAVDFIKPRPEMHTTFELSWRIEE